MEISFIKQYFPKVEAFMGGALDRELPLTIPEASTLPACAQISDLKELTDSISQRLVRSNVGIGMAALPAGIIASGLNEQIHRRRVSLERQFRKALEDGVICNAEEVEIETLRKELGISQRAADHIRAKLHAETQVNNGTCNHCDKPLSVK